MSTTYRVLSDQLYRSVALVTTANVVTEAYDCDAYGNTLCYSGPGTDAEWFTDDDVRTNNPINTTIFTGRQYDPESLIYYYRGRYYSPKIGRFISRDFYVDENGNGAEMTQGANLYWYTGDNPLASLDPQGQFIWIPLCCAACFGLSLYKIYSALQDATCAGYSGSELTQCLIEQLLPNKLGDLAKCIAAALANGADGTTTYNETADAVADCVKCEGKDAAIDVAQLVSCFCCAGPLFEGAASLEPALSSA